MIAEGLPHLLWQLGQATRIETIECGMILLTGILPAMQIESGGHAVDESRAA
jgi:hypothetical protein